MTDDLFEAVERYRAAHPKIAKFWTKRSLREVMTEPPEFTDAKTWNLDRYRKD